MEDSSDAPLDTVRGSCVSPFARLAGYHRDSPSTATFMPSATFTVGGSVSWVPHQSVKPLLVKPLSDHRDFGVSSLLDFAYSPATSASSLSGPNGSDVMVSSFAAVTASSPALACSYMSKDGAPILGAATPFLVGDIDFSLATTTAELSGAHNAMEMELTDTVTTEETADTSSVADSQKTASADSSSEESDYDDEHAYDHGASQDDSPYKPSHESTDEDGSAYHPDASSPSAPLIGELIEPSSGGPALDIIRSVYHGYVETDPQASILSRIPGSNEVVFDLANHASRDSIVERFLNDINDGMQERWIVNANSMARQPETVAPFVGQDAVLPQPLSLSQLTPYTLIRRREMQPTNPNFRTIRTRTASLITVFFVGNFAQVHSVLGYNPSLFCETDAFQEAAEGLVQSSESDALNFCFTLRNVEPVATLAPSSTVTRSGAISKAYRLPYTTCFVAAFEFMVTAVDTTIRNLRGQHELFIDVDILARTPGAPGMQSLTSERLVKVDIQLGLSGRATDSPSLRHSSAAIVATVPPVIYSPNAFSGMRVQQAARTLSVSAPAVPTPTSPSLPIANAQRRTIVNELSPNEHRRMQASHSRPLFDLHHSSAPGLGLAAAQQQSSPVVGSGMDTGANSYYFHHTTSSTSNTSSSASSSFYSFPTTHSSYQHHHHQPEYASYLQHPVPHHAPMTYSQMMQMPANTSAASVAAASSSNVAASVGAMPSMLHGGVPHYHHHAAAQLGVPSNSNAFLAQQQHQSQQQGMPHAYAYQHSQYAGHLATPYQSSVGPYFYHPHPQQGDDDEARY